MGGLPNGGKTMLAWQMAQYMAGNGATVGYLCSDGEVDDLDVRTIQSFANVTREEAEHPTVKLIDKVCQLAEPGPVVFDDHDVDTAIEYMEALPGDSPCVLFVDSLQTVRTRDYSPNWGDRERVESVIRSLRRAARAGFVIVATSEVSRAFYKDPLEASKLDPMACFKHSGSVEYFFQVAILLVPTDDVVVARMAKNKRGDDYTDFALQLDKQTARFKPTDYTPTESKADNRRAMRAAALRADVLAVVCAKPGISISNIKTEVTGKGTEIGAAIQELARLKLIEDRSRTRTSEWHVTPQGETENETNNAVNNLA